MDEPSTTQAPLGVLLGIVNQLYRTRMSVIAGRGDLTPTKLALLSHLSRHDGPVSIGELAEALEINQPGVTKVVRRLAEDGLVTVEASAEDRRRRLVAVTATGLDRMGTTLALVSTDMATWFEGWSDDDLTVVHHTDRQTGSLAGRQSAPTRMGTPQPRRWIAHHRTDLAAPDRSSCHLVNSPSRSTSGVDASGSLTGHEPRKEDPCTG